MFDQFIIPVLVTFFTGLVTWFFARKKNSQDLVSMKLDNEIKSAKYYQDLLDDMSKRLDRAINQLMVSEDRNQKLTNQLIQSEDRSQKLEHQIRELIAVNTELVGELQKFKQLNGKA